MARLQLQKLRRLRELEGELAEREAERLASVDAFAELGYVPHEQQRLFHEATEDEVLYGGSAGGGKSVAVVMEGLRACVRYAGMRVLLVRRSYDELAESIFPVLAKFGYAAKLGATKETRVGKVIFRRPTRRRSDGSSGRMLSDLASVFSFTTRSYSSRGLLIRYMRSSSRSGIKAMIL